MMNKTLIIAILFCGAVLAFGACGGESKPAETVTLSPDATKKLFSKYCVLCHGEDGKREVNGAKDLTLSVMSLEERKLVITKGKNLMTPFEAILSEEEIDALAAYTMTFK